ncbi:MAG TPA: hypothetical protein VK365_01860 [Nocardioidaceae bacterium]|jgi:hypothetical protein|nr:hypothetical protein [Nocardioidaceae bacterium]
MPVPRRARQLPTLLAVGLLVTTSSAASSAASSGASSGAVPAGSAHSHADRSDPSGEVLTTTTVTTDPDDTVGPLDLAAVKHRIRQAAQSVRVRWTVRTHERFDPDALHHRHRRFTVELDTDGEPGAERNVRIVARRGGVVAEVVSNATRTVIARLPTTRPGRRSLAFSGDPGLVGARRYFWYSDFHARGSSGCGRRDGFPVVCQDTAPERGWIRLDVPAWPASENAR